METIASLAKLRRKRGTQRTNITRFVQQINAFDETTDSSEIEYVKTRLQETLTNVLMLDDAIQDSLDDTEYEADVLTCEDYVNQAKRAILKAGSMEGKLSHSTADIAPSTSPVQQFNHNVRLPPIKLEPFSGDIEQWARFWEQFESSVDADANLSTVNKHIFLRGYLEGEPKNLVEGIAVTAAAYEQTKQILQARYGDKNRIIQAHIDYLENITPVISTSPEALNATFIDCNKRIQALQSLGEDVEAYGRVLVPKILRAFPEEICKRWIIHAKREHVPEVSILQLIAFLSEEVDGALTAQKIRGDPSSSYNSIPTTASFNVRSNKSAQTTRNSKRTLEPNCVFCEKRGHWGQNCDRVKDVHDRLKILKTHNRCFLCLNQGHIVKDCRKKGKVFCSFCKKDHHRSICTKTAIRTTTDTTEDHTAVTNVNTGNPQFTYLQTARAYVIGPTGISKQIRCVLDGGSQSSFISRTLIDNLKLEVVANHSLVVDAFESIHPTSQSRRLVRFTLKSAYNNARVSLTAFESSHTFTKHPSVSPEFSRRQFSDLQLADPTDGCNDLPIELLIGADHYWEIVKDATPIRVSTALALVPSKLGWILSGNRSGISANYTAVNHISMTVDNDLNKAVKTFWEIETIGITANPSRVFSNNESAILEEFRSSYCIQQRRRVVRLPRKINVPVANNRLNAERRFNTLCKRLSSSEKFREIYYEHMLDYITKGHVEEVHTEHLENVVFYLPHHAVKKDKFGKTKWRIVFDASSHETNAPSLNDALEVGPNLLPEILAILLRFRLNPIAIMGDIKQAFLQLILHEDDRDLTRFFWYRVIRDKEGDHRTTDEITIYRFTRLPFGLTCSPFLLSATLREISEQHRLTFPTAASLAENNFFMDDFVSGTNNENEAIALYYELSSMMKLMSFDMAKWATNSEQLKSIWKAEAQDISSDTQVLGVYWNTEKDCFYMNVTDITNRTLLHPITKRTLLRVTAKFFDPLGLFAPVSLVGKLLFQDTWCRGIGWNELLPPDIGFQWNMWVSTLPSLSKIRISRWLATSPKNTTQIHVFCDASERAYGAALYTRTNTENHIAVRLACSKTRLAPVKKLTLPRLELLAALIGARLLCYFCTATNYKANDAVLWTDAMVTLGWIRSNPNRWKTFICNRVTEIHTYTDPSQWRHCPGNENPADYLTRGLYGDRLQFTEQWWKGPSWLALTESEWPSNISHTIDNLPEERKNLRHVMAVITSSSLMDCSKFSSYWELIRITGWILRFIYNLRQDPKLKGELKAVELARARQYWVRVVQQESFSQELYALNNNQPVPKNSKIARYNPYIEEGLLRIGGRLHYAALPKEQRHPILLDGTHHFTRLLIWQTHIRLQHLGVRIVLTELRREFWIIRARQTIKKVLHSCLRCKIIHNRQGTQIEAPLPADRIRPTKPFSVVGIDFAGPLYVRIATNMQKAYITLFTCATTRAVHLELCSNMATDTFLMALQRFVNRRGLPHTIYTDNAPTFRAVNAEMKEIWNALSSSKAQRTFAREGIEWKFIAPRAAWWGGFWERMVATIKRCLRKILGLARLTEEQLNTTLTSIEAAVNSRPITQGDDTEPLTPSHFLIGEKLVAIPTGQAPNLNTDLTKAFRLRQQLADSFWKRWTREYLLELKGFHEVKQPPERSRIRLGDVVLLQEDMRPRNQWKRARIEKMIAGRDNKIRTVVLRTPEGSILTRPVQLVIPLEIDQGGEDMENR